MTVVGFAVAGGRSQRMGEDKALLPWGETDLLGHTLLRLEKAVGDARILPGAVSRYEDRGSRVVLDGHVDQGPLAGLLAALDSAPGCGVLLLGVDLPLIPVELTGTWPRGCTAAMWSLPSLHVAPSPCVGPMAPAASSRSGVESRRAT